MIMAQRAQPQVAPLPCLVRCAFLPYPFLRDVLITLTAPALSMGGQHAGLLVKLGQHAGLLVKLGQRVTGSDASK